MLTVSDTVPDPLEVRHPIEVRRVDDDGNAAAGCFWGLLFSVACWLVFIVGLLAFAGLIHFS